MRTTIELKPEHRAKLLEIAARRGEKGFSSVIAEAVDAYLARAEPEERRTLAARLSGSLSRKEGDDLRQSTKALRARWR